VTDAIDLGERHHLEEAVAWAARVHETDFTAWDEHAQWLRSHPENARLYGRAVLALDDVAVQLAAQPPFGEVVANDNAPVRRTGWRIVGALVGISAIAACGLLTISFLPLHQAQPHTISVPEGQTRSIKLPDGTILALNGGSELRIDAVRRATLERGEIFVSVHHDQDRPFELIAGDRLFRDVGTAFNVSVSNTAVRLDVAEGAVRYEPDGAPLEVKAGQGLVLSGESIERYPVPTTSIGSWRQGRLSYRNARVSRVAEDLTRVTGVPIEVPPSIRDRSFTGVIILPRNDDATRRMVGSLLDVSVHADVAGWHLESRHSTY